MVARCIRSRARAATRADRLRSLRPCVPRRASARHAGAGRPGVSGSLPRRAPPPHGRAPGQGSPPVRDRPCGAPVPRDRPLRGRRIRSNTAPSLRTRRTSSRPSPLRYAGAPPGMPARSRRIGRARTGGRRAAPRCARVPRRGLAAAPPTGGERALVGGSGFDRRLLRLGLLGCDHRIPPRLQVRTCFGVVERQQRGSSRRCSRRRCSIAIAARWWRARRRL
jgi:hypothetical protein